MSDTVTAPRPKPGILDIQAYVPGESSVPGGMKPIKLSSNETPLGASPKAQAAYKAESDHLERYPDGASLALRKAIGAAYGLNPDRIVCGCGSDELLNLLAHAYLGQGDEAVYSEHGFLVYKIVTLGNGAKPVITKAKNMAADIDAMIAALTPRTKIVFLDNPNNPTGTYLPFSEVRRLHKALRPDTLLVLDSAYAEYVRRNDYESGIELVATAENVVMTRTFSKIYGLAALRLGWAYCPQAIADVLNRIRGPFNLSTSQLDAAEAAVRDRDHVNRCRSENTRLRHWLAEALAALGVPSDTSLANFVLARFADTAEAEACNAYLQGQGLIVRRVSGYKLPHCLRITIGDESSCRRVAHAMAQFKGVK